MEERGCLHVRTGFKVSLASRKYESGYPTVIQTLTLALAMKPGQKDWR